jgi:hypothetical protein
MGNFIYDDFTTMEEGFKRLHKAVDVRNQMGGGMYWNICEEDCLRIADHLSAMGADKNEIAKIGDWKLRY